MEKLNKMSNIYKWNNQPLGSDLLDVCVVGINRIEILEKTIASFHRKVISQWGNVRVIANIDPFPDPIQRRKDFLDLFECYFSAGIVRIPNECNFSLAVKWVWSTSSARTIFHLEDDWLCLLPIQRQSVEDLFGNDDSSASPTQVLLPKVGRSRIKQLDGFSLNPSFISGEWARCVAPFLRPIKDPEKQIRHDLKDLPCKSCKVKVYEINSIGPVTFDSGAMWKAINSVEKRAVPGGLPEWKRKGTATNWVPISFMLKAFDGIGGTISLFYGTAQIGIDSIRKWIYASKRKP